MARKPANQFAKELFMKKGFTLIELLVVVLIIGILSAVALPQYEKAVEKSRAAEAVQMLRYLNQQQQLCVLAQDDDCDTRTFESMGAELKGLSCGTTGDEEVCCNKHWCYVSNGISLGDSCPSSIGNVIAARVDGIPSSFDDLDRRYLLEYETCEGSAHSIVCYESDKWCKLFKGNGNPI